MRSRSRSSGPGATAEESSRMPAPSRGEPGERGAGACNVSSVASRASSNLRPRVYRDVPVRSDLPRPVPEPGLALPAVVAAPLVRAPWTLALPQASPPGRRRDAARRGWAGGRFRVSAVRQLEGHSGAGGVANRPVDYGSRSQPDPRAGRPRGSRRRVYAPCPRVWRAARYSVAVRPAECLQPAFQSIHAFTTPRRASRFASTSSASANLM